MIVKDIMKKAVATCAPESDLRAVIHIMGTVTVDFSPPSRVKAWSWA
jgi:hypothetical protein